MRQLFFIAIIVVQTAATFGQALPPAAQTEPQWERYEAIEDHSIQGQLYPNPWADPKQHFAVSMPIVDGVLQCETLTSAYPDLPALACVLVRGEDQIDKDVAKVLDRFIVRLNLDYQPKGIPLETLLGGYDNYAASWTFLDSLGRPMAGATVEAQPQPDNLPEIIPPYKATLDDKGQMPRRIGAGFIMKVEHPDYGVVIVDCEHVNVNAHESGVYVLPLVPRGSPEFSLAAQGEVTDDKGQPVPNAVVECSGAITPDGNEASLWRSYPLESHVITDARGRFAICLPTVTRELRWQALPRADVGYRLVIEPPVESNLPQAGYDPEVIVQAGTKQTIVLSSVDPREYFHTFSFEYAEGPITSEDELRNVRLTLSRDGRPWRRLTYEQWKNGVALPQGDLQATTTRWGKEFSFTEIILSAGSPTDIVVKAPEPIVYRGRVVDGLTGEPIAGAFVETARTYSPDNPRPRTDAWWQQLRDWAAQETAGESPQLLCQAYDRATTTDTQGVFQFTFVPGMPLSVHEFHVIASDGREAHVAAYLRRSSLSFPLPRRHWITDLGTIKVSRPEKNRFPPMVFQNETGPVTDANRLKTVSIEIRGPGLTMMDVHPYGNPTDDRAFVAGTYCATAIWDDKLYTFEPVEVNDPKMDPGR